MRKCVGAYITVQNVTRMESVAGIKFGDKVWAIVQVEAERVLLEVK